jgi:phenylalanyl-tRNA synthetase beta chain
MPELDVLQNVVIINPLSQDLNVMRQSLLFSGLENIGYNQNRRNTDIKLYEFGRTYHKTTDGNIENQHLQILVSGRISSENWGTNADKANFYFMKEKVGHILNRLGIKNFKSPNHYLLRT